MILGVTMIALGFVGMELASWAIHRYLMHGPLWFIHQTHHAPGRPPRWEWNDVFTLFFGGVAVVLIVLGSGTWDARFWLGVGIALYGTVYFVVHDLFIHRRLPKWAWRSENPYLRRLYRGHQMHHQSRERLPSRAYGLLWVRNTVFEENKILTEKEKP
ncbi:MAG: fatty acid hydroxylase [Catalinimonas sp.]